MRYFDVAAEKLLTEARKLSGSKHVSIVIGNPCFGTSQGWKGGGSPWRQLVKAITKIVRRRIKQKGEKWTFVAVDEQWTTKQYVSRNILHTLDKS